MKKIYKDSREQSGWDFTFHGFEQEVIKLDTGDYYVEELPDLIFERKASTGELAINLGSKWKQFEAEMQRMKNFKYAYIICEFPIDYLDLFPKYSGIPERAMGNIRMNSGFLKKRLFENCSRYNITPLFFNNPNEAQNGVVEIINNNGKPKR